MKTRTELTEKSSAADKENRQYRVITLKKKLPMQPEDSEMGFRLTLMDGSNYVYNFPVRNEVTIGRSQDNDIIINHPEVSGRHARIVLKPRGWYLEDMGSLNGTFFQGSRITLAHLFDNDVFQIGPVSLHFSELPQESYGSQSVHNAPYDDVQHWDPQQQQPKGQRAGSTHGSSMGQKNASSGKMYIWGGSVSAAVVLIVLLYLFLPIHSAETGTLETCMLCKTGITSDVHTVSVSYFNKKNYTVNKKSDQYCAKCGNELVTYWVHYKCQTCGRDYMQVQDAAPRKNNQRDKFQTEGYCSPVCQEEAEKSIAGQGAGLYMESAWDLQMQKRNPSKK